MKITILTPSFNQGSFIERNIQSVLSQNHDNFEHIIIDGGSKDNTIEILKKYSHLKWVSERDEGQADALNKGLAMATGDIVGWINSDDYYRENIFQDVLTHFENSNIHWIIADITYVYGELDIEKYVRSTKITYKNLLKNPDIVKQQGAFFRKEVLNKAGGWNKDLHMVMDYDLWLRLSKRYPPKMVHNNYAYFTHHADQKSTPGNTFSQVQELRNILISNNADSCDIIKMVLKKYYYLFKSLIKNLLIDTGMMDGKYADAPFRIVRESKKNTIT